MDVWELSRSVARLAFIFSQTVIGSLDGSSRSASPFAPAETRVTRWVVARRTARAALPKKPSSARCNGTELGSKASRSHASVATSSMIAKRSFMSAKDRVLYSKMELPTLHADVTELNAVAHLL